MRTAYRGAYRVAPGADFPACSIVFRVLETRPIRLRHEMFCPFCVFPVDPLNKFLREMRTNPTTAAIYHSTNHAGDDAYTLRIYRNWIGELLKVYRL